jgi:putative nucleotidyltransferase with HDIG domain
MTRWLDNWFKGSASAAADRAARILRAHAWSPALLDLLGRIAAGGHRALLVGGTARDPLLRRPDQGRYDVATDLLPQAVTGRFARVEPIGFEHGTVLILEAGLEIECTTFRREGAYSDARRPDQVLFTSDPLEDLDRRDLTVNALAFDPASGTLLDPHGGALDAERRVLRAVGDPLARFREDALRPIRVARLAAALEMEPDPALEVALRAARIPENGVRISALSAERVGEELTRLMAAPRPSAGIELLSESGALDLWMPELARCRGVPQNRFHAYDVYFHSLYTCDAAPPDKPVVRWAALLHDIGKPDTRMVRDGEGTFYEHQVVGADLADRLLERLRMPLALREAVVHLVREHMFEYRPEWTDGAVRRWLRRVGTDHVADLFDLRIADALGNGLRGFPHNLEAMRRRIARVLSQSRALTVGDLAVDGRDVMQAFEIGPGRAVGESLERLLQEVLDRPELNTREQLLARLHEWRTERGLKS